MTTRDSGEDDRLRRIRQLAYRIWQEEGEPEGRAEIHWTLAEQEIAEQDHPVTLNTAVKEPSVDHDDDEQKSFTSDRARGEPTRRP